MTTGSIEITDSDALSCVLGYYLDDIESRAQKRTQISSSYIYYIDGPSGSNEEKVQTLPALSNLITKKESEKPLCKLNILNNFKQNQLFFNQVTPSIRLYKIFKINNEYIELDIPFDIVAGQKYFEIPEKNNNFVEKLLEGGSGNAVGISGFAWKSEGKNEGNNTIFTVDFKIVLQSVSELETVRNKNVEKNVEVTLLDLLYPPTKKKNDEAKFSQDPSTFEPEQMFIKADVGWNMPYGYEEYEKFFKTSLYLHLYKHNFTFHDSGKVELSLTYIGNIETIFNDKTKYDILASQQMTAVSRLKTALEQIINVPKTDTATLISLAAEIQKAAGSIENGKYYNININQGTDTYSDQAKEILEKINSEIISKAKVNFFNKILKSLLDQKRIFTFKKLKEDFNKFKSLISAQNINSVTLNSLKKTSRELNKQELEQGVPKQNRRSRTPPPPPNLENGLTREDVGYIYDTGKYLVSYENLYEELNNPEYFGTPRFVNYVYLDDLITTILDKSNISDKNIKIFFGPYSFKNYKKISDINKEQTKRPLQKVYINNQPKYYKILELEKKVGNIGHIPISLDVLINWYNEEVIKSDETGYSFFEFLKKCFNTLIPQSIGSKNAPNAPEHNVLTTNLMFNATKDDFNTNIKNNKIDYKTANKYYNSKTSPLNTPQIFKNIFYLSSNEDDMTKFKGEEDSDCELEVLHLHINDIKNIIKKANFRRDDNQKLETANLLAANSTEGNKIIRQVYHCDLEMFGNNFFEPGNLIYIKPNYAGVNLSMDILFKIGLGGYYRVIRTENDIGVGSFTTRVNCRWEMFGGGYDETKIIDQSGIKEEDIYYSFGKT